MSQDDDKDEIVELPEVESRVAGSLKMLPLQDAPRTGKNELTVKRSNPGRPRKVERMPQTSDLEYHAEMMIQKERHIQNDRVFQALGRRAESVEVIRITKEEIAREAAAIEFTRLEAEKRGKDVSQTHTRRIDALMKVASMELEAMKLGANVLDLRGEKMQRVFAYFVQTIRDVAAETLTPEAIDLFFNRLETALQGWEDKAAEEAVK